MFFYVSDGVVDVDPARVIQGGRAVTNCYDLAAFATQELGRDGADVAKSLDSNGRPLHWHPEML